MDKKNNFYDKLLDTLKNNKIIAYCLILTIILSGVSQLLDAFYNIREKFSKEKPLVDVSNKKQELDLEFANNPLIKDLESDFLLRFEVGTTSVDYIASNLGTPNSTSFEQFNSDIPSTNSKLVQDTLYRYGLNYKYPSGNVRLWLTSDNKKLEIIELFINSDKVKIEIPELKDIEYFNKSYKLGDVSYKKLIEGLSTNGYNPDKNNKIRATRYSQPELENWDLYYAIIFNFKHYAREWRNKNYIFLEKFPSQTYFDEGDDLSSILINQGKPYGLLIIDN